VLTPAGLGSCASAGANAETTAAAPLEAVSIRLRLMILELI